jgi:hypothetical protein
MDFDHGIGVRLRRPCIAVDLSSLSLESAGVVRAHAAAEYEIGRKDVSILILA